MDSKEWNSQKGSDKLKTLLRSAGLSLALAQASYNSLNKTEKAKIERVSKGSGWHEEKAKVPTPEGIKEVAPRHREVAVKKTLENTERVPMVAPEPKKEEAFPKPIIDDPNNYFEWQLAGDNEYNKRWEIPKVSGGRDEQVSVSWSDKRQQFEVHFRGLNNSELPESKGFKEKPNAEQYAMAYMDSHRRGSDTARILAERKQFPQITKELAEKSAKEQAKWQAELLRKQEEAFGDTSRWTYPLSKGERDDLDQFKEHLGEGYILRINGTPAYNSSGDLIGSRLIGVIEQKNGKFVAEAHTKEKGTLVKTFDNIIFARRYIADVARTDDEIWRDLAIEDKNPNRRPLSELSEREHQIIDKDVAKHYPITTAYVGAINEIAKKSGVTEPKLDKFIENTGLLQKTHEPQKSITIDGFTYIERLDGFLDFDTTRRYGTPHGHNTIKKLVNYAKRKGIPYTISNNGQTLSGTNKIESKVHNTAYFLERMTNGEITDGERIEYNNLLSKQLSKSGVEGNRIFESDAKKIIEHEKTVRPNNKLDAYLSTMPPMNAGKAKKALAALIRTHEGKVMTKQAWVEEKAESGGKIGTSKTRQYKKEEELERQIEIMRRDVPWGNDNHPETKRWNAMKKELADGIYKEELHIEMPDGTIINKTEADYFNFLTAQR